jgi:hypothetical protein
MSSIGETLFGDQLSLDRAVSRAEGTHVGPVGQYVVGRFGALFTTVPPTLANVGPPRTENEPYATNCRRHEETHGPPPFRLNQAAAPSSWIVTPPATPSPRPPKWKALLSVDHSTGCGVARLVPEYCVTDQLLLCHRSAVTDD